MCYNFITIYNFKFIYNYRFQDIFDIPAVGCIDCTHIAIVPPKTEDEIYPELAYVNRKGYHSINVQLVNYYKNYFLL